MQTANGCYRLLYPFIIYILSWQSKTISNATEKLSPTPQRPAKTFFNIPCYPYINPYSVFYISQIRVKFYNVIYNLLCAQITAVQWFRLYWFYNLCDKDSCMIMRLSCYNAINNEISWYIFLLNENIFLYSH